MTARVVTLHVDRGPGQLVYRLFGPDGPIGNPVAHSDVALREALARSRSLLRRPETPTFHDEAITVGNWLYRNLVPETIRNDMETMGGPIVVSTSIHGYPFELFHDGAEFLGIRFATSRSVDIMVPTGLGRPVEASGRMRVLVLGSDPRGDLPFAMREVEVIAQRLGTTPGLDNIEVRAGYVTKADVLRSLQQGTDIVHYCGHVERRGDGAVGLLLADAELLTADEIGNCRPTPAVAFLNACGSTSGVNDANGNSWSEDLSSVVGGFIRGGTRAAIGTSSDISDAHAAVLAEEFYRCVAQGLPLGECLQRARRYSRDAAPDSPAFLSFVLYGSPTFRLGEPLLSDGPTPNRWNRRRWLIAALVCVTGGLLTSRFVPLRVAPRGPAPPTTIHETQPPMIPSTYDDKARVLLTSAEEQRQYGRMDEARTLAAQALEVCAATKNELCRADALCTIARIATDRGEVDFAFRAYTEALPAYEEADLDRGRADVSLGRGTLFADRQPLEAERLYREAINLFAKDMLGVATTRLKLGDLLRKTGRYYQAEHELDLAADGFRKLGDDVGLAKTLASLAYLYSARDDFDRARDLMLKVNDISNGAEREKCLLRSVFHEWQGASLVRGPIGAAGRERLRQALVFAELSGNTERIASVLTSQARYEMRHKEYGLAMEISERALKARESPLGRAETLLVQSQILAGQEDGGGAVAIAQRASSLYSAAHDELGMARAYGLLALLLKKEHPTEAAAYTQRSQESLDNLGLTKFPSLPTDFRGLARRPREGMEPAPTLPPGPEELGR